MKTQNEKNVKTCCLSAYPSASFVIQCTGHINGSSHIFHSKSSTNVSTRNFITYTRCCTHFKSQWPSVTDVITKVSVKVVVIVDNVDIFNFIWKIIYKHMYVEYNVRSISSGKRHSTNHSVIPLCYWWHLETNSRQRNAYKEAEKIKYIFIDIFI